MPPRTPGSTRPDPSDRFRRTRAAHARETAEDYVEAVAELIERHGEARVGALAAFMGVSHVTVSRIIGRLASAGLVRAPRRAPITLTARGRRLAERARARHDAVMRFLRSIGVGPRQAAIDAEGIEHHVSEQTIRAMLRVASRASPGG